MSDLHKNWQAYQELQQQIKALQEKATLLMMEGRSAAINDIKALIAAYDLTAEELGYAVAPPPPRRERKPEKKRDRSVKNPPKYRDPGSGLTWTGNGRVPDWLIGKNYDDFLIDRPAPQEKPVLVPPHEYAPAPSPAVDASHAVQGMVSASMPQPAAAWPDPRQNS
jgi:DNA-binding protein H-NS